MPNNRVCDSVFALWKSKGCSVGDLRLYCLCVLGVVCLLEAQAACSQKTETPMAMNVPMSNVIVETDTPLAIDTVMATKMPAVKQQMESEISVMGMVPYGDYRLFSATVRCEAWTLGVEYDRHSWGHFLGSQMDYVAEIIPLVLLSQPAVSDFWGNAKSPNQELVHGVSLSPFGFRWLWRSDKAIKPYVVGKIGAAVFDKKAFSPNASYANFNVQAAFGVQIRMTRRIDLRIDPFEFFHVSNGYLAASNPGMDELATKFGVTYHLGKQLVGKEGLR